MPELICYGIALFFSWLFGLAAWHKLRHRDYYRRLLASWLAPGWLATTMVWPVVMLEGGIALALLFPATRNTALVLAAGLLVFYAMFMGWFVLRGRTDLKCGCAGPASDTTISVSLLWRNLACALLALLGLNPAAAVDATAVDATAVMSTVSAASLDLLDGSLVLMLALFMCLFYLCCEQLLSNAQRFALGKN